jgi:hypothetical protein
MVMFTDYSLLLPINLHSDAGSKPSGWDPSLQGTRFSQQIIPFISGQESPLRLFHVSSPAVPAINLPRQLRGTCQTALAKSNPRHSRNIT